MLLSDLSEVFALFGYGLAAGFLLGALVWLLGYTIYSGFALLRE